MTIRHCHEVRPLLMAYLDSELDPTTTLSLTEHVSQCAACRQRLLAEQALEQGFSAALVAEAMPADFSARLDAALAREAGVAPAHGARRPASLLSRASWYAAAALLLVALGMWLRDPGVARIASPSLHELSGSLVAAYQRAAAGPLSAADLGAEVLAERLSDPRFAGRVLPDGGLAGGHHPFRLIGSQEAVIAGAHGLSVSYDCCGALTTVMVVPLAELPPALVAALANEGSAAVDIDGVQARVSLDGGALIGVASRHSLVIGEALTH